MIVMGVFTFVFAYFRRFRGGRIALDVQHDLRTAIFRQLQRLDFARHDEMSTGQLVSRASSDVALVQGFLQFLPIGVANILLFVVSLTVMFVLSPLLALVMLAVAPLLLVHRDEAAHVGVPRELGRAAEGGRRRQRRRGRRHRRAGREGLRAGGARARAPRRSVARRCSRRACGW